MITEAKLQANKANAQKSTGPRTEQGRRNSSRNALKHGLTAGETTIDENEAELFPQFQEGMLNDINPQTREELALAEHITACQWRLRRILRLETERLKGIERAPNESLGNALLKGDNYKGICALSLHENRIQRSMIRAYKELRELRKNQPTQEDRLAVTTTPYMKNVKTNPPNKPGRSPTQEPVEEVEQPLTLSLSASPSDKTAQVPVHEQAENSRQPLPITLPLSTSSPMPKAESPKPEDSRSQSKIQNPQSTLQLTPRQQWSLDRLRVYQRRLYIAKEQPDSEAKRKELYEAQKWVTRVIDEEKLRRMPKHLLDFDPTRDIPAGEAPSLKVGRL